VLITGGLGFIGSNIAHKLVHQGAKVTIIDSLAPLYGGNLTNVKEIHDDIVSTSATLEINRWFARSQPTRNHFSPRRTGELH
jgi:nucleoside-diphosphate-sugar epimerase